MADSSLDDIIRKRQIRFSSNKQVGFTTGKKFFTGRSRIGIEPTGDVRSKIIQKKRANIQDARQNLATKRIATGVTTKNLNSTLKSRISAPKSVITAPSDDDNQGVRDARTKISLKKSYQTSTGINTKKVQQIVNDIKHNNFGQNLGLKRSTLINTLNSIGGVQDRSNRFTGQQRNYKQSVQNRTSRPVQYVTEEIPVEYEEVPYNDYMEEEDVQPIYEYEDEEPEIIIEEVRPKPRTNYQQRNYQGQQVRTQRFQQQQQQSSRFQPQVQTTYVNNGYSKQYDATDGSYNNNYQATSGMNGSSSRMNYGGSYIQNNNPAWANNTQVQQRSQPASYQPSVVAQPQQPRRNLISNNLRSRLDQQQPQQPVTMLDHPGYKVLVTNLNVKVTLEDIKELFGNIGPLRDAYMSQRGTAEVIYINEADAYSSVQAYNDRLLDGQPMNVLVLGVSTKKQQFGSNTQARQQGNTSFLRSARGGRSQMM